MTQWYVKDLSKLTGVSVQTLHHYDRIDLLKPSVRLSNGYRLYSEKDLLKLQQIIALKYFGFELSQIKSLLINDDGEVLEHFSVQARFLEQKANALLDASKALKRILSDVTHDKSIPWETIIKLIEVYRMTQQLEHDWVKEIFTPEELRQYADFEAELKARPEQEAEFESKWNVLTNEIQKNLNTDPASEAGIRLSEKIMTLINELYGKKYAHLRTIIFEKGFGEGKGLDVVGLTPEMVAWMDKGFDAYYRHRIYHVLSQVGRRSSSEVLKLWNEVLDEMYGENNDRKQEVIDAVMEDEHVSHAAKQWLKSIDK